MADNIGLEPSTDVSFCSSLKDDVWHNLSGPNAFESWHFDAVSDDGREALVIAFYDNYVLSPRFYINSNTGANVTQSGRHRFPAVSFVYSVDGRPVISAVNEFVDGDFRSIEKKGCAIGNSFFNVETADYGRSGERAVAVVFWEAAGGGAVRPARRPGRDAESHRGRTILRREGGPAASGVRGAR